MKNYIRFLFLLLLLVSVDQLLKLSFLAVSLCNKNIAWSLPMQPGFFYFVWIIIFLFIVYYFLKSQDYYKKIALVFILCGAVSNIIDRLARGCVIDFIDLKFWPVFNLADIYITIGVIFLIIALAYRKS